MIKKKSARKATAPTAPVEETPTAPTLLPQIQRLASMGADYGTIFNQHTAKGLYAYYSSLSNEELIAQLKVPTLTAIERSIIVHISKINIGNKNSLDAIKYLHERLFGKVENKMEVTGANGGALKVETDHKVNLERSLSTMSDEQLKAFEQNMQALQGFAGNTDDSETGK